MTTISECLSKATKLSARKIKCQLDSPKGAEFTGLLLLTQDRTIVNISV